MSWDSYQRYWAGSVALDKAVVSEAHLQAADCSRNTRPKLQLLGHAHGNVFVVFHGFMVALCCVIFRVLDSASCLVSPKQPMLSKDRRLQVVGMAFHKLETKSKLS